MLLILFGITVITTIGLITGGSICMYVNNDKSQECSFVFAIGLGFLVCIIAMSIFFGIIEYFDPSLSSPSPSGPILPLSSSPSGPSKTLLSRMRT